MPGLRGETHEAKVGQPNGSLTETGDTGQVVTQGSLPEKGENRG